jgi:hypothetical protein
MIGLDQYSAKTAVRDRPEGRRRSGDLQPLVRGTADYRDAVGRTTTWGTSTPVVIAARLRADLQSQPGERDISVSFMITRAEHCLEQLRATDPLTETEATERQGLGAQPDPGEDPAASDQRGTRR